MLGISMPSDYKIEMYLNQRWGLASDLNLSLSRISALSQV